MDDRWQEVDDWLGRALEVPTEERAALLEDCEDTELRSRVERMLRLAETSGDLIPPGGALDGPLGDAVRRDLAGATPGASDTVELPASFDVGQTLADRYRLEERIGRGGMGVVFRARDAKLDRDVAVKIVAGTGRDPSWRERLLREARAAAALNHPALVAIYDVNESEGTPFLVMELVEGQTLDDKPPRSPDEAVRVARRICDALDHAHRRGLVHRDLKPANILRSGDQVKVTDLGVALWTRDPRLTHTGRVLGTPAYMAPEQARAGTVDGRADLYALGVMLFLWVVGRLPFESDDPMVLVSQHVHAPITRPRLLHQDLPPALDDVIVQLLAKDPNERFATAAELATALDRIGAATPTSDTVRAAASPALSAVERGRKAFGKHRWTDAYAALTEAADADQLEPGDFALLASAARWTGRYDEVLPHLENAAEGYRRAGDAVGAAHMALELCLVHLDRRRGSAAAGWLRRAETLLADQRPEGRTHAYLAWMKNRSMWMQSDWDGALHYAEQALALSRKIGDRNTEALSLLDLGHIRLAQHRYDEAAPFLDEAGALVMSGELGAFASGFVMCGLIFAWRTRGNWTHAADWTDVSIRWCERENVSYFPGLCRIHRGELIRLRGWLEQAEQDLERGTHQLLEADSYLAGVGYRELGEVRLRRGNLDGAKEAFRRAIEMGTNPQPGLAKLRRLQGDAQGALREIVRALAAENQIHFLDRENRVYLLPEAVTIAIAAGDLDQARQAVAELESLSAAREASAHRASAAGARGELMLAEGRIEDAIEQLESSWGQWCQIDAPYEAAIAKTLLAEALRRAGDDEGARLHFEAAASVFERLGAELDHRRALERLEALADRTPAPRVGGRGYAYAEVVDERKLIDVVGQEGWEDLAGWLRRELGQCCTAHAGSPVERLSSGFGAVFPNAEDAVRCAIEMQTALRQHRSRHGFAPGVRIGVAGGDPALEDASGVAAAQSIAGQAKPGEILASRAAADGAGLRYEAFDELADVVKIGI